MIKRKNQYVQCPKCQSRAVGENVYGDFPPCVDEDEGYIIFQGCGVAMDTSWDENGREITIPPPEYRCHKCYYEWSPGYEEKNLPADEMYYDVECPHCGEFYIEEYYYDSESSKLC